LDLTFAKGTRGTRVTNVKSAPLVPLRFGLQSPIVKSHNKSEEPLWLYHKLTIG
jgi:hypothetical protein